MPQRHRVLGPRALEHEAQGSRAARRVAPEIYFVHRLSPLAIRIVEPRRARTFSRIRAARRARRHERLDAVQLEGDPSGGDRQLSAAALVDVKGVHAAHIGGGSRRRVHHELPGRRLDERVDRAAIQRETMVRRLRGDEADAGVAFNRHSSNRADVDARARGCIGRQRLADGQPSVRRQRRRADARLTGQLGHLPGRRARVRGAPNEANHQHDRSGRRERGRECLPSPS